MAYTMQNIIERLLPDALGLDPGQFEADPDSAFSWANCMGKLNEANDYLASHGAVTNSRHLRYEYDFPVATLNQAEYLIPLPSNFHFPTSLTKIRSLTDPTILGNVYLQDDTAAGNLNSLYEYYNLRRENLVIHNAQHPTYRLVYVRQPGKLHFGAVLTGSTSTSVVTNPQYGSVSPGNNFYNGDKLGITRANGDVEVREITGFNYSSKTFTTLPFSFTPNATDKFSIMPFLPTVYGDLFVLGAAMRFPNIKDRAMDCGSRFVQILQMFQSNVGNDEPNSPVQVLQVQPGLAYVGANLNPQSRRGYNP
jgi:hypothetical protein